MKFIEKGINLELTHVLKAQSILYNSEIDSVISKMVTYAENKNVKVKRILTITKGLNFETGKQRMVMDFYLELNQPTSGNNAFVYLNEYRLENCVVSKYKGHPQNASMATKEVNEYIRKNEFDPISPVHQIMKLDKKTKKKEKKKNEVDLAVYIAIS